MPAASLPVLSKIPAFPPVAFKLLKSLESHHCSLQSVSDLVSSDAVLSGRVLRYANSPVFRFVFPIASIQQAVSMIGTEEVRLLSLTASVAGMAKNATQQQVCWSHSVATAVLAEEIARATDHPAEALYAAGLLHDIGRIGMLASHPTDYLPAVRRASTIDPLDFERERFGTDHTEVGRWLCEEWKLPEMFRLVAGRHHDRQEMPTTGCPTTEIECSLRIVRVACRLASYFGHAVVTPATPPSLDEILSDVPEQLQARLRGSVGTDSGKAGAGDRRVFREVRPALRRHQ